MPATSNHLSTTQSNQIKNSIFRPQIQADLMSWQKLCLKVLSFRDDVDVPFDALIRIHQGDIGSVAKVRIRRNCHHVLQRAISFGHSLNRMDENCATVMSYLRAQVDQVTDTLQCITPSAL